MNEPRMPQDHLAKVEKPKVVAGDDRWTVTHQGITLVVLREALDDFELLDDLAALQADEKKGSIRFPPLLRRLAGEEGYRAVTDGMRGSNGRVPIAQTVQFILEVFQALNPNS